VEGREVEEDQDLEVDQELLELGAIVVEMVEDKLQEFQEATVELQEDLPLVALDFLEDQGLEDLEAMEDLADKEEMASTEEDLALEQTE